MKGWYIFLGLGLAVLAGGNLVFIGLLEPIPTWVQVLACAPLSGGATALLLEASDK